jgi:hypothetical protein
MQESESLIKEVSKIWKNSKQSKRESRRNYIRNFCLKRSEQIKK